MPRYSIVCLFLHSPLVVPRGSLNVIVVALIALLLISTSLEVVRETARALVSLADLKRALLACSDSIKHIFHLLAVIVQYQLV